MVVVQSLLQGGTARHSTAGSAGRTGKKMKFLSQLYVALDGGGTVLAVEATPFSTAQHSQ
jgi:hypothetical protein